MAIWFRNESCTVGVDDGVIRAADFARFTSLLSAAKSVSAERQRMLIDVQAQIAAMQTEASANAGRMLAEAQAQRERGFEEGFQRGMETAAAEFAEKALRSAWNKQQDLERQTERLSGIVAMAVDRVIEQSDRADIHRRALRSVAAAIKDTPLLTMRVPEGDQESARAAIDAVLPTLGSSLTVDVRPDGTLPPGACVFESELGVIDASLDTQMAAIKRAIDRAAGLAAEEAMAAEEAQVDGHSHAPRMDGSDGSDGPEAPGLRQQAAAHEADRGDEVDGDGDGDGDGDMDGAEAYDQDQDPDSMAPHVSASQGDAEFREDQDDPYDEALEYESSDLDR